MPQRPQHPKHTHHPRLAHPHPSVPGAWLDRPHGALASRWHGTCSKTPARPSLQPHGQSLKHRRAQIARAEARCSRCAAHVMTPRICPQKPPERAPSRSSNSAKPRLTSPFRQPSNASTTCPRNYLQPYCKPIHTCHVSLRPRSVSAPVLAF